MDRTGIFAGDDPFVLARAWLAEAEAVEVNDPNAIALSTVDADGMPNARMVLLKDIEDAAFVGDTMFMPDYGSARADFPGGDARALYHSVRKILALPESTRIFCCHDYKAPGREEFAWETTVGAQRRGNLHLHDGVSEAEFVAMRRARDKTLNTPQLLVPAIQINIRAGDLPPPEDNGVAYLKVPLNTL